MKSKVYRNSILSSRYYIAIFTLILGLTLGLSLKAEEAVSQSHTSTANKTDAAQVEMSSVPTDTNTHSPSTPQSTESTAAADNSFFMDYINYGVPNMPYKSYSKFGFGSDGLFYGQKGNQLILITIQDSLKVWSEDSTGNKVMDFKATTNKFVECLIANGNMAQKFCMLPNERKVQEGNPGQNGNKYGRQKGALAPECSMPDLADDYVLALSWQPGFCITKPEKKECHDQSLASSSQPSAQNFSLHGLWPNKQSLCGIEYAFCGAEKQKKSFLSYTELDLNAETKNYLESIMPSVKAGSGLERHEWYKHGTCQTNYTADEYFSLAGRYVDEMNHLPVMEYLRKGNGKFQETNEVSGAEVIETTESNSNNEIKKIDIEEFKKQINSEKEGFGPGAANSLHIICKKHKNFKNSTEIFLMEIRFQLKSILGKTLRESLNREAKTIVQGCGAKESKAPINVVPYMLITPPPPGLQN